MAGNPYGDHIDRIVYDVYLESLSASKWRSTLKTGDGNILVGEHILK